MPATATKTLEEQLDRLANFEPTEFPVLSLYLNTQPNEFGRGRYQPFVRQELAARKNAYPLKSVERESYEQDAERIRQWVETELPPQANGVALFACGVKDLFEAIPLEPPIEENRLYTYHQPHLYTLAKVLDQYPRYAAVVADTNSARIYVFGLRGVEREEDVQNKALKRTKVGGWSQQRYQRHVENFQAAHVKDLVETLDQICREEKIDKVLFGGDEVLVSFLREQLTPTLAERVVDVLKLDIRTPQQQVLDDTFAAIRALDQQTDRDKVERILGEWRAGGLGTAGLTGVLAALARGQVDELLLTANFEQFHDAPETVKAELAPHLAAKDGVEDPSPTRTVLMADELVTRARQIGAQVTFVEDAGLLEPAGGVAASLRYRV